jgi:hypothetical protein
MRLDFRKCDECKREFRPCRRDQSYCSPRCRRDASYTPSGGGGVPSRGGYLVVRVGCAPETLSRMGIPQGKWGGGGVPPTAGRTLGLGTSDFGRRPLSLSPFRPRSSGRCNVRLTSTRRTRPGRIAWPNWPVTRRAAHQERLGPHQAVQRSGHRRWFDGLQEG